MKIVLAKNTRPRVNKKHNRICQIEQAHKLELRRQAKQLYDYKDMKLLQCYYDFLYKRDMSKKHGKRFRSIMQAFTYNSKIERRNYGRKIKGCS